MTFETISSLMTDMVGESATQGMFPGEYYHLGGDEVDTKCWTEVEHVREWLKSKNMTANDAYGYFVNRVIEMAHQRGREAIAWEEVYNNHKSTIPKDTIIHMWLGDGENLKNIVGDGFRAIVSNSKHWYLPQLWETWEYYYGNDL